MQMSASMWSVMRHVLLHPGGDPLKHQLAPLLRTDRTAYVTGKADLIVELLTQARQRNS
jgi:hypothetical protein